MVLCNGYIDFVRCATIVFYFCAIASMIFELVSIEEVYGFKSIFLFTNIVSDE